MDSFFGLEKPHKIADGDEVSYLTTVTDVVMLGMVRGLLEDEQIPYLVHDRGCGQVTRLITGFSLSGTDIYVPTSRLEDAQALIAGFSDGSAQTVEFVDFDTGNPDAADAADETVYPDGAQV